MKNLIIGLIVFSVLSACAVSKKDIEDINNQIALQNEKIAHLEELMKNHSFSPDRAGTVSDQSSQNRALMSQLQSFNNRLTALETGTTPSSPISVSQPVTVETPGPVSSGTDNTTINRLYQEGRTAYESREFPRAIRAFQTIIDQDPNHDLAANSQYWIGESYYALADFSAARLAFQKIQENYPNSNKFIDAQLKIAMTWIRQNRREQARTILQAIKRDFPNYERMSLVDQNLRLTQ